MTESSNQQFRKRLRILMLVAACVLIAVTTYALVFTSQVDETTASSRMARPIQVLQSGFASSKSCQECHEGEHNSWHQSYHRTMTQVITPETAPSCLSETEVCLEGIWYRFIREGDRYFCSMSNRQNDLDAARRELLLMTGSHHMHVFWYDSGKQRAPAMLPVMYYIDEQRWLPKGSTFLRPPGTRDGQDIGTWNVMCSNCHATMPRQRFDRESSEWDTHVVEFGISCEACHGGGAEHARQQTELEAKANASNASPANTSLTAVHEEEIVNPSSVLPRVASDICGRCHSVLSPNLASFDAEAFSQNGDPHRPGQLLSEHPFLEVVRAGPQHSELTGAQPSTQHHMGSVFWTDGMIRLVGREYNGLIESPCYQHGEMTCLSCHTMHPDEGQLLETWKDDQLKPGMRGDRACLQCHAEYSEKIVEHTHHAADSSGSRCQNCHMPNTTYGLLSTTRSHQISSPKVTATMVNGERPNACALCHLDRTENWFSERLHEWYDQPIVELDEESNRISAALMHFLTGDAAQRAVQASAFGWQPAREASGTAWMEPFLLLGLTDPYDAVRIISARALRTLPDQTQQPGKTINAIGMPEARHSAVTEEMRRIRDEVRFDPRPELLIDDQGVFDLSTALELYKTRSQRPVELNE